MAQRISYIIGFASYLALVSFLGWSNTFAFSQLPVENVVNSQTYSLIKTLFNVGAYCLVAIWGITSNLTKRSRDILFTSAVALTLVGAIITSLSSIYPLWFPVVLSAGLIGTGQALLFLVWQAVYADIDYEKPYVLPALATGLSALLYLSIVVVSTEQILELVSIILIPATGAFYVICIKTSDRETSTDLRMNEGARQGEKLDFQTIGGERVAGHSFRSLSISLRRNLLTSFLVFVCVAFMWAMMRSYSSGPSVASDTLTVIGRLVSAALIMVIFYCAHKQVTVISLFQFVFPVLAIGFILLPVFNSVECNIVVSVLAYTVHSMISIVAMVECRQLYLEEGISPLTSVGVAWGGVGIVTVFGRSIGAFSVEFNFVITLVFVVMYVVFQVLFFRMGKQEQSQQQTAIDDTNSHDGHQSDLANFAMHYGFTQREEEVFELLLKGRTSKQIADKLYVSNNTVLTHLKNIYRKTGVHSKAQIVDLFEAEIENRSLLRN